MKYPTFSTRPEWFELDYTHPLAQGLVFAGLGRFTGSSLYKDSSLYGKNGTLTNFADIIALWSAQIGRQILEVPANSTLHVIAMPTLSLTPPFSIALWFRPYDLTNRDGWADNIAGSRYAGVVNATTLETCPQTRKTWTVPTMTAGTWYHFAWTCDSASVSRVFLNGSESSSGPQSQASSGTFAQLIRYANTNTASWRGGFSDYLYWSRQISDTEITVLADSGNVMLSVGGNPLLRYRRKWWPVGTAAAPAAGNRRRRLLIAGVPR